MAKPQAFMDVLSDADLVLGRKGSPCANLADVDVTLRPIVESECTCCRTGQGACLIRLLEQALADNTRLS